MIIVCNQKTQEHMISQPLVRMQSSGARDARSRSMQGRVCLLLFQNNVHLHEYYYICLLPDTKK